MIAAAAYPRFLAGEFAEAGIVCRRRVAAAIVDQDRTCVCNWNGKL